MKFDRRSIGVVILGLLLVGLMPVLAQDETQTLHIGYPYEDIVSWDPHKASNEASLMYYDFVYDTLIWMSPEGDLLPRLATDWQLTDETLTLTLREGVTFHDGTPFDAEAVKTNIERAQTIGSSNVKTALANITSVDALDTYEVRFNLSQRDELLLPRLTRYAGMMVSPTAFDSVDAAPVGTGGWMLNTAEIIPGSVFIYDRYADHWHADEITFDRIEIQVLRGPAVSNALLAGDVDMILTPAILTRLLAGEDYQYNVQNATWYMIVIFDRNGEILPELADQRVRCALNYALNREAHNQAIEAGRHNPMQTIPPQGWYGYTPDATAYDYNPQEAQALLEAAGASDFNFNLPSVGNYQPHNQSALGFYNDIGLTVNIETLPDGSMFTAAYNGETPLILLNTSPDHFTTFVRDFILADGVGNPFGVVDEDIEALVAEAQTLTLAEAEPLWQEISMLINERCYFIPITSGGLIVVTAPHVEGVTPVLNQTARLDLYELSLTSEE